MQREGGQALVAEVTRVFARRRQQYQLEQREHSDQGSGITDEQTAERWRAEMDRVINLYEDVAAAYRAKIRDPEDNIPRGESIEYDNGDGLRTWAVDGEQGTRYRLVPLEMLGTTEDETVPVLYIESMDLQTLLEIRLEALQETLGVEDQILSTDQDEDREVVEYLDKTG